MKAAAYEGVKDIRLVEVSDPVNDDDGVIIHMKACGICGSDMHVYNAAMLVEASTKVIDGYRIIGHEFTGEIVDVGKNVTRFAVGDRVASVHNKGGLAEYVHIPGDRLKDLFKLPDSLSFKTAATLEPFCNPTHSFFLREPGDDDTVAMFGAGILGLGYLQNVKARTRAVTAVVDVSEIRLDAARKIGADHVINAKEEDPVKRIKELTGEHEVRYNPKTAAGCDIAVDSAGISLTLNQCMEVLKPENGTVIVAAAYEKPATIDPNMFLFKYMYLIGSMGYSVRETEEALDLIASERVDRDMLITDTFPLGEVAEGFAKQADTTSTIKVVVINE
jgi:threonine dehydrogenase-like Zn-dependent dehydrogenase